MIRSLLFGSALALSSLATFATAQTASKAAGGHMITMDQADIRAFIDDVSIVTGKTFIVDQRVQGKVTISSEESLSKAEVFAVFKDVMRVNGYAVTRTPTGEYRISLLQGAAQDSPFVETAGVNGQIATTVIRLQNVDASEAAKLIKPVMNPQGVVTANPGGNVLVVSDFSENLRKAREIVARIDTNDTVVETVNLSRLTAIDAEEALSALGGARPNFKVIAVPGSNSLILEGKPEEVARLRGIVTQMESGAISPRGAVSVVPLRFADGASLIEILTALLPAYAREGEPVPTVAYEQGSNTLIISANGDTQAALEGVIRRLDQRRPQVLVEAIIVEISDTAARNLGVQFAVSGLDGNDIPFIGTNFSQQPGNVLALTGALGGDQLGLSDALQGQLEAAAVNSLFSADGVTAGGASLGDDTLFSVIVNAIEEDDNSNILSTPFVTTLDNIPATFLVGQEIPITTGSTVLAGGDGINPFQTIERKEVGIKLEVVPQISEGDVIRLSISQEVSSISGALTALASDFVTNKREIETTVLANDGEIIVLGGLVQDDEQINIDKVPLLGDIPIAGNLFKSTDKSRVRTNLMVFLRPTIIRNAADARPLTQYRLNQSRIADTDFNNREVSKIDSMGVLETPTMGVPGGNDLIPSSAIAPAPTAPVPAPRQ